MAEEHHLSIAEAERRSGVAKDTLRIWERRYGFPTPDRSGGARAYSVADIERLQLLRRLVERGHRPAKIVPLPLERLQELEAAPAPPIPRSDVEATVLQLLRNHAADALRAYLARRLSEQGLGRFVQDVAAPLSAAVGREWSDGGLAIFEEHLFTEQITRLLRGAVDALPAAPEAAPHVLLTTLPGEVHTLGLLMAEAVFAVGGARCTSLGAETPEADIAAAAQAHRAQVVAVSFSSFTMPQRARRGLQALRDVLSPDIHLWAGGAAMAARAARPDGVRAFSSLQEIAPALDAWRAAARDAAPV
jgi:DNA-binding transcriptional MerR regulator/methylmalonyl-CoA mutase cobalamin-binding subunit